MFVYLFAHVNNQALASVQHLVILDKVEQALEKKKRDEPEGDMSEFLVVIDENAVKQILHNPGKTESSGTGEEQADRCEQYIFPEGTQVVHQSPDGCTGLLGLLGA